MGLFRSKSTPQGPLPDLELHLASQQDTIFKPNDTISGRIALSTPIPITPQAVEVSLWGQSETWIRRESSSSNSHTGTRTTDYHHYRDHAPLFHVTFNLFPKPHALLPDQTYNYPFSFRVPEGSGFNRSNCYENPNDNVWTAFQHHLPPTFVFGHEDKPDNCSIAYGVTARLICPGIGVGKPPDVDPLSCTAPILFQPPNPNAHITNPNRARYDKRFTVASSVLTGRDPASIGFGQRMRDRLSSATPKLDFELGVETPDLLASGSEFSFRTTFNVLQRSDKVVVIPPITFKILKLELLDFTLFRAPRDWAASNTMMGQPSRWHDSTPRSAWHAKEEREVVEKKKYLNSIPEFQVVELPEVQVGEKKQIEQAGQCEAWFRGRVPGFTPPSFRSFAITRTYRLKVKLRVEIGGKHFDFSAECPNVQLGSV
ncbi:hypothetical protein K469DRAFT_707361 [Zopfia rhizophila CBS 207.26]|uniref:Arrestin-like N-terminal domain-containing protein n=1 Tax=Zopfia rhizophila CBS 207.26 TaxID=1314779 RepID=A0A6A6E163_9PEZI|nr:hypothetical protein K469DRAFT_707361 [Zopfia rhizophila CBS 207.26]